MKRDLRDTLSNCKVWALFRSLISTGLCSDYAPCSHWNQGFPILGRSMKVPWRDILKWEPRPVFIFPGPFIHHLSPPPHSLAPTVGGVSAEPCVLLLGLYSTLFFTPLLTNLTVHCPRSDFVHPSKGDAQHCLSPRSSPHLSPIHAATRSPG